MESLRRSLKESTVVLKIGCVLHLIAFIIFVVGFSTPYWRMYGVGHTAVNEGLWRRCACGKWEEGICDTCADMDFDMLLCSYNGWKWGHSCPTDTFLVYFNFKENMFTGWLTAVRVLLSLGLVGFIVSAIVTFVAFFTGIWVIKIVDVTIKSVSGAFVLVGVILYGRRLKEDVHYSFVLSIVGIVLCAFSALLVLCDIVLTQPRRDTNPARVVYTPAETSS